MQRYETAVEAPCKSMRGFAGISLLPRAAHTPMLGKSSTKNLLDRRYTFASFKRQSEPRKAPAFRRQTSLRRSFCLAHQDAPDV
jgi:hypothetical protein